MPNWINSIFFGIKHPEAFGQALSAALKAIEGDGIFTGDQLFTFGRNLSFLENERFMSAFNRHAEDEAEKAIIWRTYILCWAGKRGMKIPGDFVECGTYKGTSARIMVDYLDFGENGRKFYLYDLFEHSEGMDHHSLPEHGADLYGRVCERFADQDGVKVIKGSVLDTLSQDAPEKIAFLHIDMNNAPAEREALEKLFPRVSVGACVVLDDYGWTFYREQKNAADEYLNKLGYEVLELPTGQGLVIK